MPEKTKRKREVRAYLSRPSYFPSSAPPLRTIRFTFLNPSPPTPSPPHSPLSLPLTSPPSPRSPLSSPLPSSPARPCIIEKTETLVQCGWFVCVGNTCVPRAGVSLLVLLPPAPSPPPPPPPPLPQSLPPPPWSTALARASSTAVPIAAAVVAAAAAILLCWLLGRVLSWSRKVEFPSVRSSWPEGRRSRGLAWLRP